MGGLADEALPILEFLGDGFSDSLRCVSENLWACQPHSAIASRLATAVSWLHWVHAIPGSNIY